MKSELPFGEIISGVDLVMFLTPLLRFLKPRTDESYCQSAIIVYLLSVDKL